MHLALPLFLTILTTTVSAQLELWIEDWVQVLPDCWKGCLQSTNDGCASDYCICDASQHTDYLPPALYCAATTCDTNSEILRIVLLLPIKPYCALNGVDVPDSVIDSAYAAACGISPPIISTPTTTLKRSSHTLELTTLLSSTSMYTNGNGETIFKIIPIVMGDGYTRVGSTFESTVQPATTGDVTSTRASATAELTGENGQPLETDAPSEDSAEGDGNGTLFENAQAGAGRWGVSGILAGLGAVAGMLMRL
ncbi:hypothetical protein M011DRAFT_478170 [Sporormia fimetaria CBS 119925]|uniref:Extracellular membrane protein CFEM domain-containing protein n=1 Tax=Sporormia fimetaria CBS 119925 TaxID=1340428 RepID=A0A6A6VA19_9PLEO|nr:hypothetical protein M011DRAFT_478170 [Sporormia fimetaria CBS 119925]